MSHGPFERHLRDAIALNRSRALAYARETRGRSLPLSGALLLAELLLLPHARRVDRAGTRWTRAGVPLLEELFVPMADAPTLVARTAPPLARDARPTPSARRMRRRIARAFATRGFGGAARALDAALDALRDGPRADCLRRHLLESARRLATRAPALAERATRLGCPSPLPLLGRLLELHLLGLAPAALLDRLAWPLQARGVPILERDLPPIGP